MTNIYSAQEICKRFRTSLSITVSPRAIHIMAEKLGYHTRLCGGKRGYHKSLYTDLTRHLNELVECDKELKEKTAQRQNKQPKTANNYYAYNGEKDNADYAWEKNESVIRKAIVESLEELDLYHGSQADFDSFDLSFLSSGWGNQAYGYGVYLSDNPNVAKDYSREGFIYTVEVPKGKYLSYEGIRKGEAMKIARDFFNYYTKKHEYGREAYNGIENEFWEGECQYIGYCEDGGSLYGTISSILGSDKDTSEYLYKKGYKGIKWEEVGGEGLKFTNYLIFNPQDIKIIKKEKIETK